MIYNSISTNYKSMHNTVYYRKHVHSSFSESSEILRISIQYTVLSVYQIPVKDNIN